jgi:hypothetical protein
MGVLIPPPLLVQLLAWIRPGAGRCGGAREAWMELGPEELVPLRGAAGDGSRGGRPARPAGDRRTGRPTAADPAPSCCTSSSSSPRHPLQMLATQAVQRPKVCGQPVRAVAGRPAPRSSPRWAAAGLPGPAVARSRTPPGRRRSAAGVGSLAPRHRRTPAWLRQRRHWATASAAGSGTRAGRVSRANSAWVCPATSGAPAAGGGPEVGLVTDGDEQGEPCTAIHPAS